MENDPLAEAPAAPCTRCDGGWIEVRPAYAEHMHPDPDPEHVAHLTPDELAVVREQLELKRRAAANSVYPCKVCRPQMFWRWAGGHFKPGHDPLSCDECVEALGGRRAARRAGKAYPEASSVPRRDLA